jgi:hypothetical protein
MRQIRIAQYYQVIVYSNAPILYFPFPRTSSNGVASTGCMFCVLEYEASKREAFSQGRWDCGERWINSIMYIVIRRCYLKK